MPERLKRRSRSDWTELLNQYDNRSCTQEEFCAERGISMPALKYHLNKRFPKKSFIPIPSITSEGSKETIVDFPNGIRLTIRG
jgi:hypothetical protein